MKPLWIRLLECAKSCSLDWHGARIAFLASFLVALFRVKTVNLAEVATGFPGSAKPESHYKRLQRFFREFEFDYGQLATLVIEWLDIPSPWVLSVDRTTWEFGSCIINILMLGVVHNGVAIPGVAEYRDESRGNRDIPKFEIVK